MTGLRRGRRCERPHNVTSLVEPLRIVVAVDGSAAANRAVRYAQCGGSIPRRVGREVEFIVELGRVSELRVGRRVHLTAD